MSSPDQQTLFIRSLDWQQAPEPRLDSRSLTIVVCSVPECAQEFEKSMSVYYPHVVLRVGLHTERAHRQYTTKEWMSIAGRCSQSLGRTDNENNTSQEPELSCHHLIVHTNDLDYVPKFVLTCADLIFWYNGQGEWEKVQQDVHSWSADQVNKYMRHCTGHLLGTGSTEVWRKSLIDANVWLAECYHWIGMDIRCKHRTWISIPLMPIKSLPVPEQSQSTPSE
jgi:hypothetical protein